MTVEREVEVLINITTCEMCPHWQEGSRNGQWFWECHYPTWQHARQILDGEDPLPDWCPLDEPGSSAERLHKEREEKHLLLQQMAEGFQRLGTLQGLLEGINIKLTHLQEWLEKHHG